MKDPKTVDNFLAIAYSPWLFANNFHGAIITQIEPLKLPYDIGIFEGINQFIDLGDLYRPINKLKNLICDTDQPGIVNLQIFKDSDHIKINKNLYLIGPGKEEDRLSIRVRMKGEFLGDYHYENISIYQILFSKKIPGFRGAGDFKDLGMDIPLF